MLLTQNISRKYFTFWWLHFFWRCTKDEFDLISEILKILLDHYYTDII